MEEPLMMKNEPGDDSQGQSLTTGNDAGAQQEHEAKPAGGNEAANQEATLDLPASPADYKIEFEPETKVDKALLGQFQNWAHENKIPLDKAVSLAKDYEKSVNDKLKSVPELQAQAMEKQKNDWLAELKADKEFGGANWDKNMSHINAAMKQYGTPELRELLDSSGMGNHPLVVKLMAQVGKDLAEPDFVRGDKAGKEKSAAEVLYPTNN